jgi:hypothetical protein
MVSTELSVIWNKLSAEAESIWIYLESYFSISLSWIEWDFISKN